MDARSQELLELGEIRRRLEELCQSEPGARRVWERTPAADPALVTGWQNETAEAIELLRLGVHVPAGGTDIVDAVANAERRGTLEIATLAAVRDTARVCVELAGSVAAHEDVAPRLAERARAIAVAPLRSLVDLIDAALDDHDGLRDGASPELASTRRQIATARAAAGDVLRAAAQRARTHLQESFLTERSGRPVLAVKASSRSAVPGIVHDRSASGQTLFVEPFDVVDANNRVRELEAVERMEIERVLARLSAEVAADGAALRAAVGVLGELDLAMACGDLSRRWDGCAAMIGDDVDLVAARHPLLDPRAAVPIDLPLTGVRALVVSGPNAGGKTVALKTLGLLALVHQLGLRPPARAARLPVFDDVLADIGDDQSIEQSLSTFSGHVRRLVAILEATGPRTLVLLDEVAAGTDPAEGAALAEAVLTAIVGRGATVIATTHHHELKAWASDSPLAANAAVGFDAERLAPTFDIRVGEPGASHAIEVAERLGLDGGIVRAAREAVGVERRGVEALLQEAAAARATAEAERDAAIAERDDAAAVRAEVERREAELASRIERMRADAAAERARARDVARGELAELQHELREVRAAIAAARREERRRVSERAADREAARDRTLGAADAAIARAGERLGELSRPSGPPPEVGVGDRVVVMDLGVRGQVVSVQGDTVEVQGPSARLKLSRSRLMLDGRVDAAPEPPAPVKEVRPAAAAVSPELDVRGRRAEEARAAVRAHIDAAAMVGLDAVRIIHGRGTGALRAAVREELARHPLVAGSQLAGPDEGGDGATIATLR